MSEELEQPPAEEAAPVSRNARRTQATQDTDAARTGDDAKRAPHREGHVHFISARPENMAFDLVIAGQRIGPFRDASRERLIWSVPAELAERFAAHDHVVKGRILREA